MPVGVKVATIIAEPELYGGYKVAVKGWTGTVFDDANVQKAYEDYLAMNEDSRDATALQALYLSVYYPYLPQL